MENKYLEISGKELFKILKDFKNDSLEINGWFNSFCQEKFKELPEQVEPEKAYAYIGFKRNAIYSDRARWKNRDFIPKSEVISRYKESRGQKSMPYEFDEKADNFILKYMPIFGSQAISRSLGLTAFICQKRFKHLSGQENISKQDSYVRNSFASLLANEDSFSLADGFINVSTPEHAYLLGLIWADGYVQLKQRTKDHSIYGTITVGVSSDDFLDIKDTILKTGKWSISKRDNSAYRWKHHSKAYISSKVLAIYLSDLNYTSKSEYSACLVLETIPNNLKKYWFRGLFDGDGSINASGSSICIASSIDQDWKYMQKICDDLRIDNFKVLQSVSKKGHKSSIFSIRDRNSVLKFLDYIYDGRKQDSIGFYRKYAAYLDFKDNKDGLANLNKLQLEVRNWMRRARQETPNRPTIPTQRIAELRCKLIQEELDELKEALSISESQPFDEKKVNLVESYDALIDLMYVVIGSFVSMGFNFEPGWKEVCKSNNSKFAPGFYIRDDGKLIKSPLYTPANLKPIVDQQIENGQYYKKKKNND